MESFIFTVVVSFQIRDQLASLILFKLSRFSIGFFWFKFEEAYY